MADAATSADIIFSLIIPGQNLIHPPVELIIRKMEPDETLYFKGPTILDRQPVYSEFGVVCISMLFTYIIMKRE